MTGTTLMEHAWETIDLSDNLAKTLDWVREVEDGLLKIVPETFLRHAHHWLILHGRYTCKARRPECWRCPIADLCRFKPKSPLPA